jgi:hypothetical protein
MRIGFCGSHRTGKTTLAKLLAAEIGATPVLSGTSAIVAKYGFDMGYNNRVCYGIGLPMQQEILDALIENAGNAGRHFVADRTPLDAAAYLLADATADRGDQATWEEAMRQIKQAIIATEGQYDAVIFVPPAIKFEPMDGKPPMNGLYQRHHSQICRGLVADINIPTMSIEPHNTTIEGRMEDIRRFLDILTHENLREAA